MSLLLIESRGLPPGGVIFTDPKTGKKFDEPGDFLKDIVHKIVSYRVANPRIFTDVKEVLSDFVRQEVTDSNCARLGASSGYCIDTEWKPEVPRSFATEKCSCNAPMLPRYCSTCGGNRVIAYQCSECKKVFDI